MNKTEIPNSAATSNGPVTVEIDATAQAAPDDTSAKPLPQNPRRLIDRAGFTTNKGHGLSKVKRKLVKASKWRNRK